MLHTLTDISKTKQGRYALFFDTVFLFSVDDETYYSNNLVVGNQYSDKDLDILKETTEIKRAKYHALNLLSHKSYTGKMLLDKLCEKTDEEYAKVAVDKMQELGLLNDLDYALRFSRDLVNLKHFSPYRVNQELKKRGIAEEYINEALEQFEELSMEGQIYKVIKQKYLSRLSDEKYRRRAVNALMRLGFSYNDISTVLRNLLEDCEYYEDFQ